MTLGSVLSTGACISLVNVNAECELVDLPFLTENTVNQSVSQSVSQPASQPASQPVSQSVSQSRSGQVSNTDLDGIDAMIVIM